MFIQYDSKERNLKQVVNSINNVNLGYEKDILYIVDTNTYCYVIY